VHRSDGPVSVTVQELQTELGGGRHAIDIELVFQGGDAFPSTGTGAAVGIGSFLSTTPWNGVSTGGFLLTVPWAHEDLLQWQSVVW